MKKLMITAAAALCATVGFSSIESANVVGYQQQSFGRKFNYVCPTFVNVNPTETLTLGAIDASDDFYASQIDFLTPDGANDTVDHPTLGKCYKSYKFWWAEDAAAGVRGWYLMQDDNGEFPMNDVEIPQGTAYCVSHDDTEPDAYLTYAGQVADEDITLAFGRKFNYVGNCTPADITLGDIDASDDFYASQIDFLTSDGANDTVDHPELGVCYKSYKFWWAEDASAGVRGWYLMQDDNGEFPMNDVVIPAGTAFCVTHDDTEPDCTITIPAAL